MITSVDLFIYTRNASQYINEKKIDALFIRPKDNHSLFYTLLGGKYAFKDMALDVNHEPHNLYSLEESLEEDASFWRRDIEFLIETGGLTYLKRPFEKMKDEVGKMIRYAKKADRYDMIFYVAPSTLQIENSYPTLEKISKNLSQKGLSVNFLRGKTGMEEYEEHIKKLDMEIIKKEEREPDNASIYILRKKDL